VALLACGVSGAFPQTPNSKVGVGTVSGTVYCTDNNLPARVAEVELDPWPSASADHPEGTVRSGMTDLDGRFNLNNVAAGEYAVSVGLAGYLQFGPNLLDAPAVKDSAEARKEAVSRLTKVVVVPGQTTTIALQTERGTEIVGSVQYDDGSPAIGLTLTFGPKGGEADTANPPASLWGGPIQDWHGQTDTYGRFHIRGVFPGAYRISVVVPTRSATEISVDPPPSGARAETSFVTGDELSDDFRATSGALRVYDDGSLQRSKSAGIRIERGEREKDVSITVPLASLHSIRGNIVIKGTGEVPHLAVLQLLWADTRELARAGIALDGQIELDYVPEGSFILRAAASGLTLETARGKGEGEQMIGAFAEVPVLVTGNVSDLTITVPEPPGTGP
jgi:hypothetical protein